VLGIDPNAAVIAESRRRCALAQLDDVVRFEAGVLERSMSSLPGPARRGAELPAVHGVFALHACDTATCDALALGGRAPRRADRGRAVLPGRARARVVRARRARGRPAHSARSGELRTARETAAPHHRTRSAPCSSRGRPTPR